MTITVASSGKREFEFVANDLDNNPCLFPRVPANHVFTQAFNFTTKQIASDPIKYLAFPVVLLVNSKLIGIYSNSDSHAVGTSQIMIRSDDSGLTWSSTTFYNKDTGLYDYSLLNGVLLSGQKIVLKGWTILNTGGVFSSVLNNTVSYGGLTYSLWSRTVNGPGGVLWRSGYVVTTGASQTALFESSDGGDTWTGKAVVFNGPYYFSEADFVNIGGSNWLSICRENTAPTVSGGNPLYYATSDDDGVTWTIQGQYDTALVNGRQPNLTKLAAGDIILGTGDRSGTSGYGGSAGDQVRMVGTTGIAVYKNPKKTYNSNPFTSIAASTTVRVTLTDHGFKQNDIISFAGATTFDGISAAELNTVHTVTAVISDNVFEIQVVTTPTVGGVAGGGSSVTGYNVTQWGWRTLVQPMYSTDGGQPFVNEISANRINVVYYTRITTDTTPVIASATLDTENL